MFLKAKSVWLGLLVYLLAEAALPVLKWAGVAPMAHYPWWKATCLIWGPVLLLLVVVLLGLLFRSHVGQAEQQAISNNSASTNSPIISSE